MNLHANYHESMVNAESTTTQAPRRLPFLLLAAAAVIFLTVAWFFWQWRIAARLDREAALIESHRGRLYFSDEFDEVGELLDGPIRRNWIAYLSRTPLNINLHKVQPVRECLEIAATYHGLWQIDLSESNLTDEDLDVLAGMTELRHLFLNDTQVGDKALDVVSKFSNLETLDLSSTKITAAGLAKWTPPKSLKALFLNQCDLAEGSLRPLKDHPHLDVFRLCDTKLTSACLSELGQLPLLDELDLSGTLVDDACVPWLAKQYKIATLKVADTQFSPEGVVNLSDHLIKFRHVDLARLPITDKVIRLISGGRMLQGVRLSGTPFTDEMTLHLFQMRALSELEVDETKMTAEGIVRLVDHTRLRRLVISEKILSDADRKYIARQRQDLELIETPLPAPTTP